MNTLYYEGTSLFHRAPAGVKLLALASVGSSAFLFHGIMPIAILGVAILGSFILAHLGPHLGLLLWRQLKVLLPLAALFFLFRSGSTHGKKDLSWLYAL